MAMQTLGPGIGPLSRCDEEESDGNDCYFSLQEQDRDSDTSESYYSVEDDQAECEAVLSMKGDSLIGDESSRVDNLRKDEESRREDDPKLDFQATEEAELCDFFSNEDPPSELKSSFVAKKEPIKFSRRAPQSPKLWPPVVIVDASEAPEANNEGLVEVERSPSLLLVNALGCSKSVEIESITEDVEVIELNDYKEYDQTRSLQDDIEIIDPDGSLMAEKPFVEFDGSKKIITIGSDDEDQEVGLSKTADWSRKRDRSPDPCEPNADEKQQSPVHRKMKKLIELAQKAENESHHLR